MREGAGQPLCDTEVLGRKESILGKGKKRIFARTGRFTP